MAREYKLKLDNKQARNIAVAYFCGIPAEILGVKFGVCRSLVYQCAVGKYSGTLEEDDLIKFYRGSGKENRDRNASNLHLNSLGFANVSSEVLPKNERFKVSGYDLANQLIRNNILNPRIDEIATETSFRYLASLKGGYEVLLAKVFEVLDPDMKIIELEFDRTLIGAYQSGDISLEQVTDVTKRHVAEKIRQGALTITPKKREAINQTLETLTDREREVLDVRFDLSGRYSSGRTLEESGKILGRSSQMVRQIEYGALRRLRHPIRVRQLKFVYGLVTDDEASYKIEEARRNESERINKFRNEAERVIREGDLDKLSVDEFEFSVRTANCLNNANVVTVGQLVKKTELDLLKYRNFGRKGLEEIKTRLQEIGIDWPGYMSTERKNESQEDIQEIVSKGDLDRISVNEIEFSVRVANCLNNVGIATVGQLVKKTECDMLKCRNFGRKSLEEIKTRLQEIGIDWSDYRQKSYKIKKCQKR